MKQGESETVKACTPAQSQSSHGFVVEALMACTWTQHCLWLCFLPAVFGKCDDYGYLSKAASSQLSCMCVWYVHECLYVYTSTWYFFAWGSSVKSLHPQMIEQACRKLICPSNFNYCSNSQSPSGKKLISASNDTYRNDKHIFNAEGTAINAVQCAILGFPWLID